MKSLRLFQTKKKSSRPLWTFWMFFLTFFTAVGATLSVTELFSMANRRVVFKTIKGLNIIDNRLLMVESESIVSKDVPIVFFGLEQIIVGSPSSLRSPSPEGDLVYIDRKDWNENLADAVLGNPIVSKLFPSASFGIVYSSKGEKSISFREFQDISRIVADINAAVDPSFMILPVPFLGELRPGQLGIN